MDSQAIEDIAFQADLLALNAALEAARSGALVSLSAQAAKDTAALLSITELPRHP